MSLIVVDMSVISPPVLSSALVREVTSLSGFWLLLKRSLGGDVMLQRLSETCSGGRVLIGNSKDQKIPERSVLCENNRQ